MHPLDRQSPAVNRYNDSTQPMRFETQAVHVGHDPDPTTGAIAPSIVLSSTFARNAHYEPPPGGDIYSRTSNPNRRELETLLAALESGAAAACFASGQAATQSVLHALNPGDHVIFPSDIYHGTRYLLAHHYARWGLSASFVAMDDAAEVQKAVTGSTRLLWVETPSNPRLKIADIALLADMAHAHNALCVVDNTWATPVWQRPLALGADLVVHSATKYFGGHSDVTSGAVITARLDSFFERIRGVQNLGGGVPSPFDCWLLLRSIPSLSVRVRAQTASAGRIAGFLQGHGSVSRVHYPGLKSNPGFGVATRQMSGFGAMLSFEVAGGEAKAAMVASKVRIFHRATSLGGYESLIEHRALVEGPQSTTPRSLLRCSIGLEHVDDLVEDLAQALS